MKRTLGQAVLKICTWPEEIRQIVQDSDFESIRVVNGFDSCLTLLLAELFLLEIVTILLLLIVLMVQIWLW